MAAELQQRAFILSSDEAFREPPAVALEAVYQESYSDARTAHLGRRVWAYMVWHPESVDSPPSPALHYYDVGVFWGVQGELCATCSCPATVICKHIVEVLIRMCWNFQIWGAEPVTGWLRSFLDYYYALCRIIEQSGAGDVRL